MLNTPVDLLEVQQTSISFPSPMETLCNQRMCLYVFKERWADQIEFWVTVDDCFFLSVCFFLEQQHSAPHTQDRVLKAPEPLRHLVQVQQPKH